MSFSWLAARLTLTRRPECWLPAACSALAWGILFLSVPPGRQDFPLDDDWAFARGSFDFASGRGIHYFGWASMPQLGQWLWAWPFVKLLGEHHVGLRISTILLSWLGVAAFADLLGRAGFRPWAAALTSCTLAFNPLFFLLQGTFMTDVPAVSFSLVVLALYDRGLRDNRPGVLMGAASVAILAALTRQNTLAVPVAVALASLRQQWSIGRWPGVLALVVPTAVGAGAQVWFQARPDINPVAIPHLSGPRLLAFPFVLVHFLGLSALPVLPLVRGAVRWKLVVAAFVVMVTGASYSWTRTAEFPYFGLFPYTGNLITPWGACGGWLVPGAGMESLVVGDRPLLLGGWSRLVFTVLGCLAGAILVARVWRGRLAALLHPVVLFGLLQVPLILRIGVLRDRYILFLIPATLFLAASPGSQGARRPVVIAILVIFAGISLGFMHDWLAWNSARWELGRRAMAQGIPPWHLEGGFEWDGWFAPFPTPAGPPAPIRALELPFSTVWYPHVTGQYALSFSRLPRLPGARPLDAEPYTLWLNPGKREFLLLKWPGS